MYIAGDRLKGGTQTVGTQNLPDSVITTDKSIITGFYLPIYNGYNSQIWHTYSNTQRHWTSFFLPVGSIFVLGLVVLLMVLFKRYPHTVAAIVAAILGIIIVSTTVILLNHGPIYI